LRHWGVQCPFLAACRAVVSRPLSFLAVLGPPIVADEKSSIGGATCRAFLLFAALGPFPRCRKDGGRDAAGIANRIREKVNDSYIYGLSRATKGDTLKFNVMIEAAPRVRIECALEYLPEQGVWRVITLY
jgi:hypothetical protein